MMNISSNNHHNEKRIISFERALQIDSKNNYKKILIFLLIFLFFVLLINFLYVFQVFEYKF